MLVSRSITFDARSLPGPEVEAFLKTMTSLLGKYTSTCRFPRLILARQDCALAKGKKRSCSAS